VSRTYEAFLFESCLLLPPRHTSTRLGIGQAYVGQAQAAFRPAARSGQSRPSSTPAAPPRCRARRCTSSTSRKEPRAKPSVSGTRRLDAQADRGHYEADHGGLPRRGVSRRPEILCRRRQAPTGAKLRCSRLGIGSKSPACPSTPSRFAENGITFAALRHLTDRDLKDIGVLLGHRRIMLAAIGELGTPATTPSSAATAKPKPQETAERAAPIPATAMINLRGGRSRRNRRPAGA
jgi:hypothetical protein